MPLTRGTAPPIIAAIGRHGLISFLIKAKRQPSFKDKLNETKKLTLRVDV